MNKIYKNMKNIQDKLLVYIYEMEQGQKENVNLEELKELLHLSCGEV